MSIPLFLAGYRSPLRERPANNVFLLGLYSLRHDKTTRRNRRRERMNAREDRSHMGNKKDMGTEEEEIVKRMEG